MIYLIKTTVSSIAMILDLESSVINGIIKTESNFNPIAENKHSKAYGLMQLKPSTEKWVYNHKKFHSKIKYLSIVTYSPFISEKIQKHIIISTVYFKYLKDRKKTTEKALFAYNNGPNKEYNTSSRYSYKVSINKEEWYVAKL